VDPPPTSLEPAWAELALLALALGLYAALVRRRPDGARPALFAGGAVLAAAVLVSPLETLGRHYLLFAHLLQNVALAEWVPLLLVLGLAPVLLAGAPRWASALRVLGNPFVALPLWLAAYAAWHVPAAYEAALRNPGTLLVLEHVTYVAAGIGLWWPIVHGRRWAGRSGPKAIYLFVAFLLASPIGLVFVLAPDAVYGYYADAPRVWGISALTDQRIAGAVMSLGEAVVFVLAFGIFFFRFLAEEEREAAPAP
jgi:cytochrome c oxidase assembly factor CtaG